MKQLETVFKKFFAIVLALCMTFTLMPSNLVKAKVGTTSKPSGYTTDTNDIMAYNIVKNGSKYSIVDIYGKVNGYWLQTTYSDNGYYAELSGDASMNTSVKHINDGRYVKLEYTVTANNDTEIKLSVDADIMIGNDDKADITKFSDNSGFKMVNTHTSGYHNGEGAQFNFYGKNVYGVEQNVDTFWFGYYDYRESNRYNNTSSTTLTNKDSGMACSWKAQNLKKGESKTYSVIIGIGEATVPPIISDIVVPTDPVEPGKDVTIEIPIKVEGGSSEASEMQLFYDLIKNSDGKSIYGNPQKIGTVTIKELENSMFNFVATFLIPDSMEPGSYTLKVFAMNSKGGVSAEISKQMSATAAKPTITDITASSSVSYGTSKTLTCTATGANLTYQWQKKVGNTFENIAGAKASSYTTVSDAEVGAVEYRCLVNNGGVDVISPITIVTTTKANVTLTGSAQLNKVDSKADNIVMEATLKRGNTALANADITFMDGQDILGTTKTNTDGKATYTISKDKLVTKTYNLKAVYSGDNHYYGYTANIDNVVVQMTKAITYQDPMNLIQQVDSLTKEYLENSKTTLNLPDIIVQGFKLVGFTDSQGKELSEIVESIRGNITLSPIWKSLMYNVTIDTNLNDDSFIEQKQKGTSVSVSANSEVGKETHDFKYWESTGITLSDEQKVKSTLTFTMPENDVNLKAVYEPKTFKVTYAGIENAINSNPTSYRYGAGFTLRDITSDNKIFGGWYSDKECTNKITAIDSSTKGDITIYAKWINVRKVTIVNDVTKGESVVEAGVGSELTLYAENLEGYDFEKWTTTESELVNNKTENPLSINMIDRDFKVTANYKAKSYSITYDLNGGTNSDKNNNSYTYGKGVTFENPTRKGYTFAGWFTDAEFKNQITGITSSSTGDITVYAKWTQNSYAVTAVDATVGVGGTSGTNIQAHYGDTVTITANEKTGYEFTGWTLNGIEEKDLSNNTFTMPDHAVSVKANYQKQRYAITYKNVEESEISNTNIFPREYIYGYEKTLANPTRTGYSFAGWFTDAEPTKPVTGINANDLGNKTFYAKWTKNRYFLNVVDGTFDDASASKKVDFGSKVSLTPKDKTGMKFVGWYIENKQIDLSTFTMPANNVVIYAKYEAQTYNITYYGGTHNNNAVTMTNDDNPTKYHYGDSITLKYPSATDLTFNGWVNKDGEKVTNITPEMTGDIKLTATWVKSTFTITYAGIEGASNEEYLLNGSTIETSTTESVSVDLPTPTKTGYIFNGWTSGNDSIKVNENKMEVPASWDQDITLTATWEKQLYTIKVNDKDIQTAIDEVVSLVAPSQKGHNFKNWTTTNTDVAFANVTSANTNFTFTAALAKALDEKKDIRITSEYEPATYNITYELGADDVVNNNPAQYTYGDAFTLATPVRYGYTFTGWKSGDNKITDITSTTHGELTLTATWTPTNYHVYINDTLVSDKVNVGGTLTIKAEEKPGYTFTGWSIVEGEVAFANPNALETTITLTTAGNVKVKPTYTVNTYTATYKDGDRDLVSDNPSSFTVESEDIILKNAVKDGYEFLGWYSDPDFENPVTKIAKGTYENITLYADFAPVQDSVEIKFTGQGSYIVKNNGSVVENIPNGIFKTDRYNIVEISFTPKEGYELVKVIVDGVTIDSVEGLYRFERLIGNHTIEFITEGKPNASKPTPPTNPSKGEDKVEWNEWDGSSEPTTSTTHKPGLEFGVSNDNKDVTTTYQVVEKGTLPTDDGWLALPEDGKLTVTGEDGSYVVYIKVTDKDGNSTITQSNILILDNTAPVIGLENGTIIYTDTKISVTETNGYTIYVNENAVDQDYVLAGNKDATYEIYVVDAAGNKSNTITVTAKTLASLLESIKDIDNSNVTSSDKDVLNTVLNGLKNVSITDASDTQKQYINEQITRIEGLITSVSSMQDKLNNLKEKAELPVSLENKNDIQTGYTLAEELLQNTNLLTEAEKTNVTNWKNQLKAKLDVIEVLEKLESIKDITTDNVTSTDKEKVNEVKEKLDELLKNETLLTTAGVDETLKGNLEKELEDLINKQEALNKVITEIEKQFNDLKDLVKDPSSMTSIEVGKAQEIINDLNSNYAGNLTDTEKELIKDTQKTVNEVKAVIDEIKDRLDEVEDLLGGMTTENVNTNDQEKLDEIKDHLDWIEDHKNNLDASLKEELDNAINSNKELTDKLEEVKEKLDALDKVLEDIANATKEEDLKDVQDKLDDLNNNYAGNLTETDKELIKDTQETVDEVKEVIETIKDNLNKVEDALKDKDKNNVTNDDQTILDEVKDALDYIEDHKNHLDETLKDSYEQQTSKVDEMNEQLTNMNQAKDKVEQAKPKEEIKESNMDEYTYYEKLLDEFLKQYGKNLTATQKEFFTAAQKSVSQAIKDMKAYMLKNLVTEIEGNIVQITSKGEQQFEEGTRIQIEIVNQKIEKELKDKVVEALKNNFNATLHDIYDITLVKDKKIVKVNDMIEIRIKLTEEQLQYGNLGVIYIDDAGNITKLDSHVEDGYIIFNVDHLSKYAIISLSKDDSIIKDTAQQQDGNILMFAMLLGGVLLLKRRKEEKA